MDEMDQRKEFDLTDVRFCLATNQVILLTRWFTRYAGHFSYQDERAFTVPTQEVTTGATQAGS